MESANGVLKTECLYNKFVKSKFKKRQGLSLARALRYSIKNDSLGIGKTFVAFDEKDEVVDYFTLTTAQIVMKIYQMNIVEDY